MKFSLFVLSLVLATCCVQSNNVFWGTLGDNDTHVYSIHFVKSARRGKFVYAEEDFPPKVCVIVEIT